MHQSMVYDVTVDGSGVKLLNHHLDLAEKAQR